MYYALIYVTFANNSYTNPSVADVFRCCECHDGLKAVCSDDRYVKLSAVVTQEFLSLADSWAFM